MSTDDARGLVAAYEPFVATLVEGGFTAPAGPGQWSAELVAAHVARNNECFTAAARSVLTGAAPVYDNEAAVDVEELRAHVERVGGRTELAAWVRRSAEELGALYDALTDEQRATEMPTTIRHDGVAIVDGPRPIGSMIEGNATYHLQMHHDQLVALRG